MSTEFVELAYLGSEDPRKWNSSFTAGHYSPDERTRQWNYYRNRSNPYGQSYPSPYPYDRQSQGGYDRYPDAAGSGTDENRPPGYPSGHGEGYDDTYSGN